MSKPKVLLGMSGGIDSFASAILLKEQGYEVIGVTFVFWADKLSNNELPQYVYEAKNLAKQINIELRIVDLRNKFHNNIITYFKEEYLLGRTPNPCVKCNIELKWEELHKLSKQLNINHIATGHYAKISKINNLYYIQKGTDELKEQSFFLWGIRQEILQKALLPLGKYTKQEVKEIAYAKGFEQKTSNKESIGMCFATDKNYHPLLTELLQKDNKLPKQGKFIDKTGKTIGSHKGYPFYTVGQRRGLGLMANKALYVLKIKPENNTIILGENADLYKTEMLVKDYYFHSLNDIEQEVIAKIRYRKQSARSKIEIISNKTLKVNFIPNEWSIAPGQTVAFYINDRVIGGGFIC